MNEIKIRKVTDHDLEGCYTVESGCFFPSEAASKATIEKRIKVFPQGFLVAELDGTIIGHINSGSTHKEDITDEAFKDLVGHDSDGDNIVIFSLAVLPEFQKRGIAKHLMLRFIAESKQLGKKKIMLICKSDLIAYYQQYGFIYVGESASTHGGFKWHEMFLPLKAEGYE
jgi:ribosomal protein S18 acetylase RimI-like enzyme